MAVPSKPFVVRTRSMKLSVFRDHYEIETVAQLRLHLSFRHDDHYASFWLATASETDPSIAVFINRDRAVAFYFRESGDSGYYSDGVDESDETVDFLINNFQCDYYPTSMVVSAADAFLAMEQFLGSQQLPSAIKWVES